MTAAPTDLGALEKFLGKAKGKTVLIVGDLMLDRFVYGAVNRISPESDAPVLDTVRVAAMPGGAGNVAANIAALGMRACLAAVTGEDAEGEALRGLLRQRQIETGGILALPTRPTTVKTRFVTAGRQLLRADTESRAALNDQEAQALLGFVAERIGAAAIVILSDYNKGVLTPAVIEGVIRLAAAAGVPVLADPKKTDPAAYSGARIITPNRKELAAITEMACGSDSEIESAAAHLKKAGGYAAMVVTRSEDGMSVFEDGQKAQHIPAENSTITDVSGAGDTVIATLAAGLAGGASLVEAARLANRAAALAVQRQGTVSIPQEDLRGALENLPAPEGRRGTAAGWDEAARQVAAWKQQGLRVGFTNGCFDILHYGHVTYLQQARERCDRLVVGLNHDASVKILKGPERPLHDENARAAVLAALAAVDMVVLFGAEKAGEDNTPCALIERVRPDVFFKGGDYTIEQLPEAVVMKKIGGSVDLMPLYEGHSTTGTIAKMKKTGAA